MSAVAPSRRAVGVANGPACLADEDDARGHVPGVVVKAPEAVEPPGRHVGEVQGRRAGAAERLRPQGEVSPPVELDFLAAQVR